VLQDPPALDDLIADPVVTERLGLVSGARDLSLDGALDGADAIRFRQLTDLKLILPHPRNWVRRLVEDAAFRRGVQLQHVQPADDVTLIKEMVHYGLGHAILPYSVVRDESVRGSLSFRRIEHEPLTTVHAIVSHRDHASSPVVAEMRRTLRGVMTELVENGHWAAASLVRDPAKSQPPQSSARVSGAAMR
jgi:DNA-binding transcriptional LysR family regulator